MSIQWTRRQRWWGLFLCLLAWNAQANPLDPSHPLWQGPPDQVQSFVQAFETSQERRPPLHKFNDQRARAVAHGMRLLVLPVLFADTQGEVPGREELQSRVFGAGEGSVRGYWDFVSGGDLQLEGVVLPWIRLPETLGFYRNVQDGRFVSGAGPPLMARDALRVASTFVDDFGQFDDDGPDGIPGSGDDDGVVDFLLILHPAVSFEVDPTQNGPALLSVQGRMDFDSELAAGGVIGDAFVVTSARGPLGVWVHEFGHLLGLEDLYDIDVSGAFSQVSSRGGLGIWSLMASGSWGDEGRRPSNLDPVSRRLLGWEERVTTDSPMQLGLATVDRSRRQSLEVRPLGDWGRERFVFERRARREGAVVDGDLPGDGILAYRVDESLRENRSATGFWIDLLEADGQADLHALRNNGDSTDPFDGGARRSLGPATNPSSQSRLPSSDRVAPLVDIGVVESDGTQRVSVALAERPVLRLEAAFFDDGAQGRRAHLRFGETADWNLVFEAVGSGAVGGAQLRVQTFDPRVVVESGADVALELVGERWEASTPIRLRETGSSTVAGLAPMRLEWTLSGDTTMTRVDLDLPLRVFGGLTEDSLDDFVPTVSSAAADTTRFLPLGIGSLPLPTRSGWGLFTNSAETYANSVEVVLEGPTFSPPEDGRIGFWSTQETEASLPGQAFDAGVVEVYIPQRGWRILPLEGGPTVHVVQRSAARVRGAIGLGGREVPWTAYSAVLPRVDIPLRLRFRFGSDGDTPGRGWSIAGLRSGAPVASADLRIDFDPDGVVVGRARLRGDVSGLATLRFRFRRIGSTTWQPATALFTLGDGSDEIVRELQLPADLEVATIALFAEVPSAPGGETPDLLLGEAAYRRPAVVVLPRLLRNPTSTPLIFQQDPLPRDLVMGVFDARGRRLRTLRLPAGSTWFEWEGDDDHGTPLASGVYFLVVEGNEDLRRRFLLLR